MIADIDAACDHVHVLFYIWLDDDVGTRFAEALMRAAARGVTCRAVADGIGSRALTLDAVRQWSVPRRLWNNVLAIAGPVL